jgi:hypothetical protein
MMSCEEIRGRLDDLVDGELSEVERRRVEAHLEACPECRELCGELKELLRETRELPLEIMPATDLWPAILDGVGGARAAQGGGQGEVSPVESGSKVIRPAVGTWLSGASWSQVLGVAAAAVVVVAVALALLLGPGRLPGSGDPADSDGRAPDRLASLGDAPASSGGSPSGAGSPAADAAGGSRGYLAVREELLDALNDRRTTLSPRTIEVIVESLGVIDESIASISQALAENPEDLRLARLLSDARRQELDLLRRATLLPPERPVGRQLQG